MALLTGFLLALPVFALSTTAIEVATHDQAGSSRVPGYTGPNTTNPTSDFLTTTFCYCAPSIPYGNASRTFPSCPSIAQYAYTHRTDYYQTDYYNYHLRETLILHQTCLHGQNCEPYHEKSTLQITPTRDLSRSRDCSAGPKTCLPVNLSNSLLAGTNQRYWGRKWFRLSWAGFWHGRVHDHLVYWPNRKGAGRDVLEFNGRKRDLSPQGGQGQVVEAEEEAERVCERLCVEQVGTAVLRVEGVSLSHQVMYGDMHDLCDWC